MKPSVITSKPAQKDLLKIKAQHDDIVRGMADQSIKVENYRQQKAAERQSKMTMENEMKKEQMVQNTAAQKNNMDFTSKQAELDIKRSLLSTK